MALGAKKAKRGGRGASMAKPGTMGPNPPPPAKKGGAMGERMATPMRRTVGPKKGRPSAPEYV